MIPDSFRMCQSVLNLIPISFPKRLVLRTQILSISIIISVVKETRSFSQCRPYMSIRFAILFAWKPPLSRVLSSFYGEKSNCLNLRLMWWHQPKVPLCQHEELFSKFLIKAAMVMVIFLWHLMRPKWHKLSVFWYLCRLKPTNCWN